MTVGTSADIQARIDQLETRAKALGNEYEAAIADAETASARYGRGEFPIAAVVEARTRRDTLLEEIGNVEAELIGSRAELTEAQGREYLERCSAVVAEAKERGEHLICELAQKIADFDRKVVAPLLAEIAECEEGAFQTARTSQPLVMRGTQLRRAWNRYNNGGTNLLSFAADAIRGFAEWSAKQRVRDGPALTRGVYTP